MNVYLYLKMFPPLGKGEKMHNGAVKAVHGLASGLVNCGAKVEILCEGSRSEDLNDSSCQTDAGYTIKWFANSSRHLSFKIATGLQEYIRNEVKPGLVILNGIFHPSVYGMSRLLKKQSIPYIVAPHDPYHPSIFTKNAHLKWPYWYFLEHRLLKQARAIQVLDSRHAQWLRHLGVATPIVETPNGFSAENVLPESTLRWRSHGSPNILFLGRIDTHNKGLDLLLEAFAQVSEATNARLVIQGPDNGDRQSLEQQTAKLAISENVTFLEPDFDRSAASIAGDCDIFCISSRFEGFSLAALEAMLAARVLLVSEVAGIAPHVQASKCGVVVKPEVEAIKNGLLELLSLRDRWEEMGLRGRHYVLNNLQWDRIASTALEHYKRLARELN